MKQIGLRLGSLVRRARAVDGRRRRMALMAMASAVEFGASAFLMLAAVWLTVPYLGAERFGLWMTITAVAAVLSFLDFGVGHALVSRVASVADDAGRLSTTIAVALGIIVAIALLVFVLGTAALHTGVWRWLVDTKVSVQSRSELETAIAVFLPLFCLQLVATIVRKIYQGLQRGYLPSLTTAAASLVATVALWRAADAQAGIPVLLAIQYGFPTLFLMMWLPHLAVLIHRGRARWSRTSVLPEAARLLRTSSNFLIMQMSFILNSASDNLLISAVLNPQSVALYVVTQRPMAYCVMPIRFILDASWAGYADATMRQDWRFIHRTLKAQVILAATLGALLLMGVALANASLISLWTRGVLTPPWDLTLLLAVAFFIELIANPFSIYMNGCGILAPQLRFSVFSLIFCVPLKLAGLHMAGLNGLVASSIFLSLVKLVVFYFLFHRKQIFVPFLKGRP